MRVAVLILAGAVALLILAAALGLLAMRPVAGRAWVLPAVLAAGTGAHAFIVGGLLAVRAQGHLRRVALLGAAAAVVAWLAWGAARTGVLPDETGFATMAVTGWTALLLVAGSALAQTSSRLDARVVRIVTVVLVALLAIAWPFALADIVDDRLEVASRLFVAFAMFTVAALGALVVLVRLRRADVAGTDGRAGTVAVLCPRCGLDQSVRLGGAACGQCGLRITVHRP